MSLYVSETALAEAVERLGKCRAIPTLCDYLIFKRALVLARQDAQQAGGPEPDVVVTGTSTPSFVKAVTQVAATVPPGQANTWAGPPFYSPFGSSRDKGKGFKSPKYPSNGPSDTVAGWQARGSAAPLQLVEGSRPKAYRFAARTAADLQAFFLAKADGPPLPALVDFAQWWFRATDLSERFDHEPTHDDLCGAVVEDFALNAAELSLFSDEVPADGTSV